MKCPFVKRWPNLVFENSCLKGLTNKIREGLFPRKLFSAFDCLLRDFFWRSAQVVVE